MTRKGDTEREPVSLKFGGAETEVKESLRVKLQPERMNGNGKDSRKNRGEDSTDAVNSIVEHGKNEGCRGTESRVVEAQGKGSEIGGGQNPKKQQKGTQQVLKDCDGPQRGQPARSKSFVLLVRGRGGGGGGGDNEQGDGRKACWVTSYR